MKKGLSQNAIKIFLMICMTLDHAAYMLLSFGSPEYRVFRFFGRMVAPSMCYFLAEGFIKTRNLGRYMKRMLIFAFLAWFPYYAMVGERYNQNMLFNLFLCLAMMAGFDHIKKNVRQEATQSICAFAILAVTMMISALFDWTYFAPLFVANAYWFRENRRKWVVGYLLIASMVVVYTCHDYLVYMGLERTFQMLWFMLGMYVPVLLPFIYSGKKGSPDLKYVFYLYYPLHILIIVLLRDYLH